MTNTPLILIADDDPVVHESLSIYLDEENYQYVSAYDGQEALSIFKEKKPDLIILDLMMPQMSGMDVCKEIRQRKQCPNYYADCQRRRDRSNSRLGVRRG